MHSGPTQDGNALLLSIQKQHADRIFAGQKTFELRKQLPREPFARVYLYETGGTGVVGYFDVARVAHLPLNALWDLVGERGTTRERFTAYFSGHRDGYAIEVARYYRFERAITVTELKTCDPLFTPPQSYRFMPPSDSLRTSLQRLAHQVGPRATDAELTLRAIRPDEHQTYSTYVHSEISRNYDEIDASFARANLATAERGNDPFALLTKTKDVLALERIDGVLLGFTTLTYKHGGSVKTGPTILLPEHRAHGYGSRVRIMLEALAKREGARKLYATAPDVAEAVLGYLLKAGMTIEAHLRAQYSQQHGEIILGKLLETSAASSAATTRYEPRAAQVIAFPDLTRDQAAHAVTLGLNSYGVRVPRERARELVRNMGLDATYDRKPRDLLALRSGESIVAGIILSAKRGGAMRGVLGTTTSHGPSLARLLDAASAAAKNAGRRKLYFLHDESGPLDLETMRKAGYVVEGILREPYMAGQDLHVVSRFLT